MAQLEDVLGPRQVAQSMGPEVAERRLLRETVGHHLDGRVGEEDLATVAGIAQAAGAVQRRSHVRPGLRPLCLAGVDRHPEGQGCGPLDLERAGDCFRGTGKCAYEAVALAL